MTNLNGHKIGKYFSYFFEINLSYLNQFDYDKLIKKKISVSTYYFENGNIKKVHRYKKRKFTW